MNSKSSLSHFFPSIFTYCYPLFMKCTFLYDIQDSRLILMIAHRTGHTHHLIKHYKKVKRYRRLQAHRNLCTLTIFYLFYHPFFW